MYHPPHPTGEAYPDAGASAQRPAPSPRQSDHGGTVPVGANHPRSRGLQSVHDLGVGVPIPIPIPQGEEGELRAGPIEEGLRGRGPAPMVSRLEHREGGKLGEKGDLLSHIGVSGEEDGHLPPLYKEDDGVFIGLPLGMRRIGVKD